MTRLENHLFEVLCEVMDYLAPGRSLTKAEYPELMNQLRKAKAHAEKMKLAEIKLHHDTDRPVSR